MRRSSDRILTTHTGSLPRSQELVELAFARSDAPGLIRFPTRQSVLDYVEAASNLGYDPAEVPEMESPFFVRTRSTIFVARQR
jgi:hypothetical protein